MTNGEPQPPAADLMREQRLQRNLKIVVGVLSALILVGLGAVIAKVAGFAASSGEGHRIVSGATTATATLSLELPSDAKIVSVSLSGNRLAVHHDGPAGTGIAILDLETGRRILDVRPTEPVPRN